MRIEGGVYLGKSVEDEFLELKLANRHGLITGATGTGKTVSLQVLAEGLADAGVSVFAADIKGDLSGIGAMGVEKDWIAKRAQEIGFTEWEPKTFTTVYWDLFGVQGHPIRATVTEMGPLLLARLMSLNDVQEGVLNIVFKLADDEGLPILDLKDLRAVLGHVAERADELTVNYGNVSKSSVGAIQRQLLMLEQQGGDAFFGEPALQLADLMATDAHGRGRINILAADDLMSNPRLYATFLLWLMSELFEELPEVGDMEKPKLVFFFDEAHLLFEEAPPALIQKVEQVVRLIRSKGVGIYFVTQNPLDVPDSVSAQLGNRVQHALRAFTPREQKAVRAAATTFRQNPAFSTEEAITELAVGEALVSMLHGKGVPTMVQRTFVRPPEARVGPLTPTERATLVNTSPVAGKYDEMIDRPSAYEKLVGKIAANPAQPGGTNPPASSGGGFFDGILGGILSSVGGVASMKTGGPRSQSLGEAVIKSAARSAASTAGRQITNALVRGVLGSLLKR